jgi:hypothetical protein
MTYTGETYLAESGQWSWRVTEDESDLCAGAGYPDQESAEEDMLEHLTQYEERSKK